jgi:hypothetical protein
LSVVESLRRDLDRIRKVAPDLADSTLAATAMALAAALDDPDSSTSTSMCARALSGVMSELRALTPKEEEADGIDELARRRESRRSAARGSRAAG